MATWRNKISVCVLKHIFDESMQQSIYFSAQEVNFVSPSGYVNKCSIIPKGKRCNLLCNHCNAVLNNYITKSRQIKQNKVQIKLLLYFICKH